MPAGRVSLNVMSQQFVLLSFHLVDSSSGGLSVDRTGGCLLLAYPYVLVIEP